MFQCNDTFSPQCSHASSPHCHSDVTPQLGHAKRTLRGVVVASLAVLGVACSSAGQ
jgi:hypothetical protein